MKSPEDGNMVNGDNAALRSGLDATTMNPVEEEKRALRRVDWHCLPLIFCYYLLNTLDR